jgi:1-acyl-sn-glycerol-3-phosphate acyltransferase
MTKAHDTTELQPMTDFASDGDAPSLTQLAAMLQWLRTRLFELVILVWSLLFGLAIVTYFQIRRSPAQVRWVVRLWSAGFIFAARWIVGVRYTIEGRENVPRRPVIFVCNHQSYWESIAFAALVPHLNIVTKAAAMDIPVFGWGLRHAPMIPVYRDRRGGNLRRIVHQARSSLAEGRSILIFPEGGRVPSGGSRRYERSLELLYKTCNVDIVPVAHNAGLCWTKGFAAKTPGLITLRFYPPIAPGMNPGAVAERIERLLGREKDALTDQALRGR